MFFYIYLSVAINKCMRMCEIEKPKTPQQLRLDQLSATSQRASAAVKQERLRQKTQRAQQALQKLRIPAKPRAAVIKPIKPIKLIKPIKPTQAV